jgi:acetyl-CoA C-acetyltransferase
VGYVFMGQVLQAGQGQATARQAAVKAGIPMSVPATTINKVCLSGLNALYLADFMVSSGEADVVVAGGMESMTKAPHLLPGARAGFRLGDATLVDSMMYDGLYCQFDHCTMGFGTDRYARAAGISREGQDRFAALSHERAANAIKSNLATSPRRSPRWLCRNARATLCWWTQTRVSGPARRSKCWLA